MCNDNYPQVSFPAIASKREFSPACAEYSEDGKPSEVVRNAVKAAMQDSANKSYNQLMDILKGLERPHEKAKCHNRYTIP